MRYSTALPPFSAVSTRFELLFPLGITFSEPCEKMPPVPTIAHTLWMQVLDLSENKLDTVSAKSLCTFLKSPTCCLREILLAKADIDDGETAIVMEVRSKNTIGSLKGFLACPLASLILRTDLVRLFGLLFLSLSRPHHPLFSLFEGNKVGNREPKHLIRL